MMPQYVVVDENHDLIYSCDHLWQATEYVAMWKATTDQTAFIYVMERFY